MTNVIRVIIIEEKQQNVDLPFDTTECWSERPALNTNYKSLTNDIKQTVIRKLSHSVQTQKLHKLKKMSLLVGKDDAGKSAGSPTKQRRLVGAGWQLCRVSTVQSTDSGGSRAGTAPSPICRWLFAHDCIQYHSRKLIN